MTHKQEKLASLPGVWATLAAGFELTTKHWWLLLIPVLLDLFLWLGPRLSFQPLIEQLLSQWPVEAALVDPRPILEVLAPRTNMFTYLSVLFIGVPALMSGLTPLQTPIATTVFDITSVGHWLGLFSLFTVLGLLLAALFYSLIGRTVITHYGQKAAVTNERRQDQRPESQLFILPSLLRLAWRTWMRFLGLAVLFVLLMIAIVIPISIMLAFVSVISQQASVIIALSTPVLFFWALIFLSFAPQGLVLNQRPFFKNIGQSVRLLQWNLVPAILLLLVITLVNRFLQELLLAADDGSWLTLVSILGHAFVTTAMLVAMFIFYRDRYTALFSDEPTAKQTKLNEPSTQFKAN